MFITILSSKVYLLKDLSDSDLMSSNEVGKSYFSYYFSKELAPKTKTNFSRRLRLQ